MKKLAYLSILLFLIGCAPRVIVDVDEKFPIIDALEEVIVFNLTDEVPAGAKLIGTIKVGDSGFTADCDYQTIIEMAKFEAKKNGANLLKVVDHQTPDLKSTCHRITANIYYIDGNIDIEALVSNEDVYFDSTANYAMIHVYRNGGAGPLVSYTVHIGEIELCKVRYKSKETIMVQIDGPNEIWAKTESKTSIPIDVEFGREYYVRCEVAMGLFIGRPKLTLVDRITGKAEFDLLKN